MPNPLAEKLPAIPLVRSRDAPGGSKVLTTSRRSTGKLGAASVVLIGVTCMSLSSFLPIAADAQAPETQRSLLTPINYESGRVEEVITAADDRARFRAYVLTWRSMRIVVAGAPDRSYDPGDNLDIAVHRMEVNGHKVLRFAESASASNENEVDVESTASGASITLGTARIEETLSAESDGYRFVGYFVTWHDKRVFVLDPQSAATRAVGETLNFRVWRSGFGATQRLSFSI